MKKVIINDYIIADPEICHGKPVFDGTRVMVWQVLDMLAGGSAPSDIFQAFPSLKPEHITAALNYASSIAQAHYVVINTQPEIPA